jgi:hypothetical protein
MSSFTICLLHAFLEQIYLGNRTSMHGQISSFTKPDWQPEKII